MEFKGTSGKWFVDVDESGKNEYDVLCNVISTVTDGGLKIVGLAEVFGDDEQAKANAKLIASAPELLKTLNLFVKEFEYENATEYQCGLFYEAKELIKKITE